MLTLLAILAVPLVLYLWMFVEVTLHEGAHVLVARLVGLSPFAVNVGKGPVIFHGRILGLEVQLRLLPFFGVTQTAFAVRGRWPGAAYAIAGIFMDMILLSLLWGLASFNAGRTDAALPPFYLALLAAYQVIIIATNLVPMTVTLGTQQVLNDGKQFFGFLLKGKSVALEAYREKMAGYDATFRIEDSWQLRGDTSMLSIMFRAEEDLAAERYTDGVDKYLRIVRQPHLHRAEKAMHLDRLASIPIFHGEKNLLAAADEWSKEAHALVPESRTVRGTRGAILIENGFYSDGIALLMPLTSEGNAPVDRAVSACYVARAMHGLGRTAEVREWMKLARSCADFPTLYSRIESELTATATKNLD